jgi:hypothetical protein
VVTIAAVHESAFGTKHMTIALSNVRFRGNSGHCNEARRIAVNIAKLPNAARANGPSRQSEPADKPSVVLNRCSCPKSIFVLRRGATLLAIVLLGHRR